MSDQIALPAFPFLSGFFSGVCGISLWLFHSVGVAFIFFSLALFFAFLNDQIQLLGVISLLLFGTATFFFYRFPVSHFIRGILGILIAVFAFLLATHRIPGFKNWLIFSQSLSMDTLPTRLYLNLDKIGVGFLLIGWTGCRVRSFREWKRFFKIAGVLGIFASTLLMLLSFLFHAVHFDFKWFDISPPWLFVNLLFVCVAEEAFFRFFLQNEGAHFLQRWMPQRLSCLVSWILTSIFFGLCHFPGGWNYVFLAIIAGLIYGFAFLKTNQVQTSILVHFFVNAIHFIFFTYPPLLR